MSLFIFIVGLFVACGSKETDTSSDTSTTTEPTSEPASSPTDQPTEEPEGCADMSTFDECFQCFYDENPTGYMAYANAIIGNCYCGTECEESCTDFCASEDGSVQPSTECETCVGGVTQDQSSACVAGFQTECSGDPACVSFVNDVNTCPQ